MAIKIQGTTVIDDVTTYVSLSGTTAVKVPSGTTAERPTATAGQLRFNSETSSFEGYDGVAWGAIGGSSGAATDTYARTIALLGL